MEQPLTLTLTSFGKLTAGKDEYVLLTPQPLMNEVLDKFPGTKFYAAYMDEKTCEAYNPHIVSVGDGFHIDIRPMGREVQVTIYDQGGMTEEEAVQIDLSTLVSQ